MGKINVNSNAYIITYSVVMVVIVAILLSVAALGLKNRQEVNVLNEKKTQIVKALGLNPEKASYEGAKITAYILDENGQVVSSDEKEVFEALNKIKDSFAAGKFPVFEKEDGSVVIPLYGNGLWGPIWGYVALEKDMKTVKGVVMDHKGETPGLGAEIASETHQKLYKERQIFDGDKLIGIVVKKGGADKNSLNEVDAISGGTKTCEGVTKMFENSLAHYEKYLKAKMAPAAENPGAEYMKPVLLDEEQKAHASEADAVGDVNKQEVEGDKVLETDK